MKNENFLRTCNNMNTPEKDFRNIFCNRCKNPRCELAEGGDSTWANRVLTQEDRLLNNPKFADVRDPQFAQVRAQQFLSIIHEAIELNSQERAADWDLKWESAQPGMFVAPPAETNPIPQNPIPQNPTTVEVVQTELSSLSQGEVAKVTSESPQKTTPAKTSFLNTPFPSDGVMIEGAAVTPAVPKHETTPPQDPWAVPEKPTNIVAVGAKVVMGGSGGKRNGP